MLGHWPSSSSTVTPGLGPGSATLPNLHSPTPSPDTHGLQVYGYADDPQVYLSISDPANPDNTRQECTRLESCLTDIHLWMSANKLKLNTDKTEALVVGTEH